MLDYVYMNNTRILGLGFWVLGFGVRTTFNNARLERERCRHIFSQPETLKKSRSYSPEHLHAILWVEGIC